MKKYTHFNYFYKGFQLKSTCIAKTNKDACKLFDITPYMLRTWVNINNVPQDNNLASYVVYFSFDSFGGEPSYFLKKEEINKHYTKSEIQQIIDFHRVNNPTYHDTVKNFNHPN